MSSMDNHDNIMDTRATSHCARKQMVLGTANSTVQMAVGSQLSATVSEGDL